MAQRELVKEHSPDGAATVPRSLADGEAQNVTCGWGYLAVATIAWRR
jgi:hypothetical protein